MVDPSRGCMERLIPKAHPLCHMVDRICTISSLTATGTVVQEGMALAQASALLVSVVPPLTLRTRKTPINPRNSSIPDTPATMANHNTISNTTTILEQDNR